MDIFPLTRLRKGQESAQQPVSFEAPEWHTKMYVLSDCGEDRIVVFAASEAVTNLDLKQRMPPC